MVGTCTISTACGQDVTHLTHRVNGDGESADVARNSKHFKYDVCFPWNVSVAVEVG